MANYSAALGDLENPISEDYRPLPNTNMGIGILTANRDYLLARIKLWDERYVSGSSKERSNIGRIVPILKSKVDAYNIAIASHQSGISTPVDDLTNNPDNTGGDTGGFAPTTPTTSTPPINSVDNPSPITKVIDAIKDVLPGTKTTPPPTTPAPPASNKKTWLIAGIIAVVIIGGTIVYKMRK